MIIADKRGLSLLAQIGHTLLLTGWRRKAKG
jgi:hypothetical protein